MNKFGVEMGKTVGVKVFLLKRISIIYKILLLYNLFTFLLYSQISVNGKISTALQSVIYCNITFTDQEDTNKKFTSTSDSLGNYSIQIITGINDHFNSITKEYEVTQNYPNPFSEKTAISYKLPRSGKVNIIVYNILGQEVKRIQSGEQSADVHYVLWEGKDNNGKNVSAGVYFYRISTNDWSCVRKMLYLDRNGVIYGDITPDLSLSSKQMEKQVKIIEKKYSITLTNNDSTSPRIISETIEEVIGNDKNLDITVHSVWEKIGPILFISKTSGQRQLYSMEEDGSNILQLTNDKNRKISDAAWSPDGTKIILSYSNPIMDFDDLLYIINSDGTEFQELKGYYEGQLYSVSGVHPVWSPDSKESACTKYFFGCGDIWMLDKDSSIKQITNPNYCERLTDWSRDGKYLLADYNYSTLDSTGHSIGHFGMEIIDLEGEVIKKWEKDDYRYSLPIYSTMGDKILYADEDSICILNLETEEIKKIMKMNTNSPTPVSWSSDDSKILFTGEMTFLIFDTTGTLIQQITPFPNRYSKAKSWLRKPTITK
jgi:flagellar hook assembly protein FlgD